METGKVTNLITERGFGFIHDGYGAQFFFHASNTQNFDDLAVCDGVAFDIGTGRGSRTCAVDVRRAKHDAPLPDAVSANSVFIKQRSYDQ